MTLDLTQFEGMRPTEIIRTLRDNGYEIIGDGTDTVVLAKPGSDRALRLTNFVDQARDFTALCRDYPDNPHFPAVHDSYETSTDPAAHIAVIERLRTLNEVPEIQQRIVGGFARALATAIDGHESHDGVHELMLRKETHVRQAIDAMLSAMEQRLTGDDDTLLYYDSGFSEAAGHSIEDWYPDNIMFRPRGRSWELVFTDPFREMMSGPNRREELAAHLKNLRARFDDLTGKNKGPAQPPGPALSL